MATEQLGTGGSGGNVIPGDLAIGGAVGFNGKAAVTTVPAIASVTDSATMRSALNGILVALKNLGLINSDAT